MRSEGHRKSMVVIFPGCPPLRRLKGGNPSKNYNFFYQKFLNNHIFKVRKRIITLSMQNIAN